MKKISILIPCYNEEENVVPIANAIVEELGKSLPNYDYELVGQFNSPYYGMLQTTGDCTIEMDCDFQNPVSVIPQMVEKWEEGAKIVSCVKTASQENPVMRFLRTCYYKLIKKMSSVEQIEHFQGFGLYDKSFIEVLRNLKDPTPFLRGIVAELGFKRVTLEYTQAKRKAGKTHNNFFTLFDAAMLSFTSYTKIGLRMATFIGVGVAFCSLLIAFVYLILKLCNWNDFVAGTAPIVIGMFFLGAVQLIFLGIIGEYILSMNQRIMNRPLVVEEERINFDEPAPVSDGAADGTRV